MRFYRKLFCMIGLGCLIAASASAGWKEERDFAEKMKKECERSPRQTPYRVNGETIPVEPEFCINIHHLDDKVAANLKKAGIKTVRHTIYWYAVEKTKTPGVYDRNELEKLDKRFADYKKFGLEPLVIVHGNAPGTGFANRQESYERFGKFMAMLAKRYPDVRYFQLWNEMDVAFTDLFGKNAKLPMEERAKCYVEMLKVVTPMIRAANPKAVVVTGGMVDSDEFPHGLYKHGGREYFDVLALHTYGMPLSWSFIGRGARVRKIMDENGDAAKPLWNTEFGASGEGIAQAWGIPKEDPVKSFDERQCDMLTGCMEFNKKAKIYSKYFVYAYHAGSEASKAMKEKLEKQVPGINFNDITFSLVKKDGTPKKFMQRLIDDQSRKKKITQEAGRAKSVDGRLYFRNRPFFPLGLVFGRTDAEMQKAKASGFNSIHQEYSLRDVLPEGPDRIDPAGVRRIRDLHETARRNGMVLFPLLTGHYIPGWLGKTAGPAPADINGAPVGLWFRHSLHHPAYRNALETFWRTVAREVGDDPNAALFVSWNEPAYGLDATPAALNAYRNAMKRQHGSIDAFNKAMGTQFAAFETIVPPAAPDENRKFFYCWFRYNQQAFADFFAWQRSILLAEAPEMKLSGKHPVTALLGDALQVNHIPLQAATQDIYGCDAYNGSLLHYRDAMEAARSLSGGGPVISYETHAQKGIPPVKPDHAALQMFVQILGGCRGIFFFCNGEQPQFGFYSDKATPPPVREKLEKLFRLIDANQTIFSLPRAKAQIAVLLSDTANLHYGSDPEPPRRDEYAKRVSQTYDLLRNQHFAVDFITESQLAGKLGDYRLLVVPSRSILTDAELKLLASYLKNGGKLLAFGKAFDRNEFFEPRGLPPLLGIDKREPAPWNRGQMRLVEVDPVLAEQFPTEIIVQEPERVNPLPMEQAIPGYIPESRLDAHRTLAANQDAYPSIVMSNDGRVVYCAFDSLYSTELSQLIGGIVERSLGIPREMRITRPGSPDEAVELLGAVNRRGDETALLFANSGARPGRWEIAVPGVPDGTWRELSSGEAVPVKEGRFSLSLPPYGYAVLTPAR